MPTTKAPERPDDFSRPMTALANARTGIRQVLEQITAERGHRLKVVIPAYYGFSPREGSGVLDPVVSAGATPVLCAVDSDLHLDLDHYRRILRAERPDVVMIIHYFGWPEPRAATIAAEAEELGVEVIEDEAHALLTDLVGGVTGRIGRASMASVHKSLPTQGGGLLLHNPRGTVGVPPVASTGVQETTVAGFDLVAIAQKRRENWVALVSALDEAALPVSYLRPTLPEGVVPLNLPLLVDPERRQLVYERMNAEGFGVVSLYYRLGDGIDGRVFPASAWLSQRLVNLPIHQDVDPGEMPAMVAALGRVVSP